MLCRKLAQVQLHVLTPLLCYLLIHVGIKCMLMSLLVMFVGSNHLVYHTLDIRLLPNLLGRNTF